MRHDFGIPDLEGVSFKGFLAQGSVKLNRNGQLCFTLIADHDDIDKAWKIHVVARNPVPLEISLKVNEAWIRDVIAGEERIRLLMGRDRGSQVPDGDG
jgi:hypothetical protein